MTEADLLSFWLSQRSGSQPTLADTEVHEGAATVQQETDYTVSLKTLQDLLSSYGFVSKAFRFTYPELISAAASFAPVLVHFSDQEGHFALCLEASKDSLVIADPAEGLFWISRADFCGL